MEMFLGVLLGLTATVGALPLVREVANENEGVNLPIYKPWYNAYSSNVFGSQYIQHDKNFPNYYIKTMEKRFPLDNYDSINVSPFVYRPNYFWKYMLPEMMYMNFHDSQNTFHSTMNVGNLYNNDRNMFIRNFLLSRVFNGMNMYDYIYKPYMYGNMDESKDTYKYDTDFFKYIYRPYSPEYTYGYMRNFVNNMRYPYNYMSDGNYMDTPYFHEYMYGNLEKFKDTDMSNDMNNFNYMYRPYSPEYMYGYMRYPYYLNNHDYVYRPHSHQYMYENLNNLKNTYNMDNSMYRPYFPEYMNGYMHSFMNKHYPYYMNSYGTYNNDYMYRPYSHEYMYGNIDKFQNVFYPHHAHDKEYAYFKAPEFMNFKNTIHPFHNYVNQFDFSYKPYSLDYLNGHLEHFKNMGVRLHNYINDNDYMYRPYSPEYVNHRKMYYPFHEDKFGYTYKPYFPGYPENFVDMSYPSNNMNEYSYGHIDYKYRPYFPEYMGNYRYPFYNKMNGYAQNSHISSHMNMENPFYNKYFERIYYGANQFPNEK